MRHTLTEIVKGTKVTFREYNNIDDKFKYDVTLEDGTIYTFSFDRSDVGNATLFAEDKALIYMRWIRKAINDGTIYYGTKSVANGEFVFSYYRAGFIYFKGIIDGKETEISFDVTDKNISSLYENMETNSTIQQWIQQAQQQCQSES